MTTTHRQIFSPLNGSENGLLYALSSFNTKSSSLLRASCGSKMLSAADHQNWTEKKKKNPLGSVRHLNEILIERLKNDTQHWVNVIAMLVSFPKAQTAPGMIYNRNPCIHNLLSGRRTEGGALQRCGHLQGYATSCQTRNLKKKRFGYMRTSQTVQGGFHRHIWTCFTSHTHTFIQNNHFSWCYKSAGFKPTNTFSLFSPFYGLLCRGPTSCWWSPNKLGV